jgi:hypothetical protein
MRADKQLHVETLLEGLQPVANETGARVRFAGRQGLDQRLSACALVEEFDVEIVLGVDAFGDAKPERRVAGGHLCPGEPDLRRRRCDRWRKDLPAQHTPSRGDADGADSFEKRSPRRLNGRRYVFAHGSPLQVGLDRCEIRPPCATAR